MLYTVTPMAASSKAPVVRAARTTTCGCRHKKTKSAPASGMNNGRRRTMHQPLNRRSLDTSTWLKVSRIRNTNSPIKKTPIKRSKTIPISMTNGIPNVVVRAARKMPLSNTRSPTTCINAFLRLIMRKPPVSTNATEAASMAWSPPRTPAYGRTAKKERRMSPAAMNTDWEDEVEEETSRGAFSSSTIRYSTYGIAITFTLNTSPAITKPSVEWCIRDTAMICAVMISDCTLNKAMHVEIRLAAAISSTVMNRKTPDEAKALAAAVSNKPIVHLISAVKTTARIASADATPRKSGTRYIRNFATLHSTSASASTSAAIFSSITSDATPSASAETLLAIPQGTKSAISNAMTTVSLIALAHSISARLGPEYSSTIAS